MSRPLPSNYLQLMSCNSIYLTYIDISRSAIVKIKNTFLLRLIYFLALLLTTFCVGEVTIDK
jgi:hypothetical protein